ncbi:hypothetical protein [Rhizobium sp. MHM7A]|uniref:hypothetical protein n=1 Tax=Rhizobium sp. MHM7A TaxID=2583233 RepID=UPI001106F638|nr:hypothetical protein [Rhizobium sp. MHM7A]TLX16562.1 hypothetical protein FFR93_04280 [Rhizobium sp. MHM7A]
MKPFSEYKAYVSDVFSSVPQWPDVQALLTYIQDKPNTKVAYGDLMLALRTDDPMRVLSATVILTGGAMPVMRPYFRVKASDGTMHDVASIPKACLDGEYPYTLEATGEVINHVAERAYTAFEIVAFRHERLKPIQC